MQSSEPIAKIVTASGDTTLYQRLRDAFAVSKTLRVPHEVQARDVKGEWVLVDTRYPVQDHYTAAELRQICTPLVEAGEGQGDSGGPQCPGTALAGLVACPAPEIWRG